MRRVDTADETIPAWVVCEGAFYRDNPGLDPDVEDERGRTPAGRAFSEYLRTREERGLNKLTVFRARFDHDRAVCPLCRELFDYDPPAA